VFRQIRSTRSPTNPENLHLLETINNLEDTYNECRALLEGYDQKLIRVVKKHENDFENAYKTHMSKVERELAALIAKARD
jgi:hypothetical protein